MELDLTSLVGQLTIAALALGVAALAYSCWLASGIANSKLKTHTWSWKRTFSDISKAFLIVYVVLATVLGTNLIDMIAKIVGADISGFTATLSVTSIVGTTILGAGYYFAKAIRNVYALCRFKELLPNQVKADSEVDYRAIGEQVEEAIVSLYTSFNTPQEAEGKTGALVSTKKALELAEMGATTYVKLPCATPQAFYDAALGRGFNEGFGYQCVAGFKEFMYSMFGKYVSAGGAARQYADEPARTNVCKLGFTWYDGNAGLQDGDWGIWRNGLYGHVSMYYQGKWFGQNQGAVDGNVGNPFCLMALPMEGFVGYFRPNLYKNGTSSTPTVIPNTSASTSNEVSYTYKAGDTFGQVIINLGLNTSAGLWGPNGDVEYYTNQLHSQGIYGNIPINTTIKLTPRK